MPISKLKNIVLVILLLTNLCLLLLVAGPALQSGSQRRQTREGALEFLQSRGVQVAGSAVPQSMTLLPQTAERSLEGESQAAAALLGGAVSAEARGGEVYRYFNQAGSIQFHSDGAVSAQLDPSAFPLGEDRAAGCLALMERLGCQGEVLSQAGDELVFRQSWGGSPLFTQQVTLVCQGDGLAGISAGRLLIGQPQEDPARSTISVSTALIDFLNGVSALGDVCNRIDRIQPGYITASSLSGPTALTPVWLITTDTGAYQLDTTTGAVSRAS